MATLRFLVSGRVQGVFFRASARAEAERLRVVGHARNLADGRGEVLASGTDEALRALEEWLRHGPPAAEVEQVTREVVHDAIPSGGFHTR